MSVTWTEEDLRLHALKNRRLSSSAKSEQSIQNVGVAEAPRTGENSNRVHVRFTSYRKRLLDRTNLEAGIKYFEDCLVYSGLVSGDSEAEITRTVRQVKVKTSAEQRTEIELTFLFETP